ncbi:adenylyl-sulfate kinase [Candidatus Bathyarchaeota archaeon]|nr:adenylyl-sulfate kinase [Candidatus Bathyarchaeota archaeon]MBS7612633.1 adenylyl-sulfate kinase [Candidatus Bathyarchaeota archaeon]MBS7617216.1 adenylyl-sulfate kinase [Candidatus Bathyarchaeota archaeon]
MTEGWAMWITGLPSSGKSTIANGVARRLKEMGVNVETLESDELRKILTPKPTYSEEERDWFYNVIVYIAKLLVRNGVNVIIDATGNKRAYRDNARRRISKFVEVYVKCSLNVCMKRDVKGLYKGALEGSIGTLPGIQTIYEEPLKPEVIVETDKLTVNESVELVLNKLKELRYIDSTV